MHGKPRHHGVQKPFHEKRNGKIEMADALDYLAGQVARREMEKRSSRKEITDLYDQEEDEGNGNKLINKLA